MNRRTFLKLAGLAAGAAAVGGLAGGYSLVSQLRQDQFQALKRAFAQTLAERFGAARGSLVWGAVDQELGVTLSQLPDVGTVTENKWASNMPPAALALAAYRVLVPEMATLDELGELLYKTVECQVNGLPALVMRAAYDESAEMEEARRLTSFFQQRKYAANWVANFVQGDTQGFAFGLDVAECAIFKYHRAQGAPALTKYLCLIDNITMGAQGRGLVRTQTLAEGCAMCDFRFKQGRATELAPLRDGWPPKFVNA